MRAGIRLAGKLALGLLILFVSAYSLFRLFTDPTVEELESKSLTFHMLVEHPILMAAGFLTPFALDKLWIPLVSLAPSEALRRVLVRIYLTLITLNSRLNKKGIPSAVAVAAVLAYWHVPANFDPVSYDEVAHVAMHLSFITAGSLIYMATRLMSTLMSLLMLLALSKVMGLSSFLTLAGGVHLYQSYALEENLTAAFHMAIAMIPMDLAIIPTVLYLVFKRLRGVKPVRIEVQKPKPIEELPTPLERRVRRFQDGAIVSVVLAHLLLIVNAAVLTKLLGLPFYGVIAFHGALQGITIICATVGPSLYRRYLLSRLRSSMRRELEKMERFDFGT